MAEPLHIIAQTEITELSVLLTAVFGAFGAILIGFYKYANAREKDFAKSRDNQTEAFDKSIEKLAKSLDANVKANKDVATQTRRAADEAEKRNGHLAELTIEARADVIKAIKSLDKQKVTEQEVAHQHVHEVVKEK